MIVIHPPDIRGVDPTTTLAPALDDIRALDPADERLLYNDSTSQTFASVSSSFRGDFVARTQAEYRTVDMQRYPRVQLPLIGRSICKALSRVLYAKPLIPPEL